MGCGVSSAKLAQSANANQNRDWTTPVPNDNVTKIRSKSQDSGRRTSRRDSSAAQQRLSTLANASWRSQAENSAQKLSLGGRNELQGEQEVSLPENFAFGKALKQWTPLEQRTLGPILAQNLVGSGQVQNTIAIPREDKILTGNSGSTQPLHSNTEQEFKDSLVRTAAKKSKSLTDLDFAPRPQMSEQKMPAFGNDPAMQPFSDMGAAQLSYIGLDVSALRHCLEHLLPQGCSDHRISSDIGHNQNFLFANGQSIASRLYSQSRALELSNNAGLAAERKSKFNVGQLSRNSVRPATVVVALPESSTWQQMYASLLNWSEDRFERAAPDSSFWIAPLCHHESESALFHKALSAPLAVPVDEINGKTRQRYARGTSLPTRVPERNNQQTSRFQDSSQAFNSGQNKKPEDSQRSQRRTEDCEIFAVNKIEKATTTQAVAKTQQCAPVISHSQIPSFISMLCNIGRAVVVVPDPIQFMDVLNQDTELCLTVTKMLGRGCSLDFAMPKSAEIMLMNYVCSCQGNLKKLLNDAVDFSKSNAFQQCKKYRQQHGSQQTHLDSDPKFADGNASSPLHDGNPQQHCCRKVFSNAWQSCILDTIVKRADADGSLLGHYSSIAKEIIDCLLDNHRPRAALHLAKMLHQFNFVSSTASNVDRARSNHLVGSIQSHLNQTAGIDSLENATRMFELAGVKSFETFECRADWARALFRAGKTREAKTVLEVCLEMLQDAGPSALSNSATFVVMDDLGMIIQELGDYRRAIDLFDAAANGLGSVLGKSQPQTLAARMHAAVARKRAGSMAEALCLICPLKEEMDIQHGPFAQESLFCYAHLIDIMRSINAWHELVLFIKGLLAKASPTVAHPQWEDIIRFSQLTVQQIQTGGIELHRSSHGKSDVESDSIQSCFHLLLCNKDRIEPEDLARDFENVLSIYLTARLQRSDELIY